MLQPGPVGFLAVLQAEQQGLQLGVLFGAQTGAYFAMICQPMPCWAFSASYCSADSSQFPPWTSREPLYRSPGR